MTMQHERFGPFAGHAKRSLPPASELLGGLLSRIRHMAATQFREAQLRRAVTELSELDDRMLQDIGLSRGSIKAAVRSGDHRLERGVHDIGYDYRSGH